MFISHWVLMPPPKTPIRLSAFIARSTRKDLKGNPKGGFYPEEGLDIWEAVDGYTIGSAYASFDENIKGRIKEGYLADLAVLSDDIFTISSDNIKDIKVEMTVVDGKIVYQRNK